MAWLQLTFSLPAAQAETVAEFFAETEAAAVTLQDAAGEILIETHWEQTPLWSKVQLTALLPEDTDTQALRQSLIERLPFPLPDWRIDRIDDEDWATAWKAHYKPLHMGGKLWICPSWCEPPVADAVNVVLDPGMAFGTGTHPTTALCLEWLAAQDLRGKTILDYGCGSGILAIAALKLGARHAIATDLDEQALVVTRENAARNHITAGLDILLPAALPKNTVADVVVANILAGALIELAPTLTQHVKIGGGIALSGILSSQAAEVSAHYTNAFQITATEREDWVRLVGERIR